MNILWDTLLLSQALWCDAAVKICFVIRDALWLHD